MLTLQVLKETNRIRWLNLGGNPCGDLGGMAILLTLNYQTCSREILLHGCTYAVAAAAKQPRVVNKPRSVNTTTTTAAAAAAGANEPPGGGGADPRPTLKRLASITYPTGR